LKDEAIGFAAMRMTVTSMSKARSQVTGVMKSVSQFIEKRLKLKVNQDKSAVDYPTNRKFLGFSFYCIDGVSRIRVHPNHSKG